MKPVRCRPCRGTRVFLGKPCAMCQGTGTVPPDLATLCDDWTAEMAEVQREHLVNIEVEVARALKALPVRRRP